MGERNTEGGHKRENIVYTWARRSHRGDRLAPRKRMITIFLTKSGTGGKIFRCKVKSEL